MVLTPPTEDATPAADRTGNRAISSLPMVAPEAPPSLSINGILYAVTLISAMSNTLLGFDNTKLSKNVILSGEIFTPVVTPG